ncbi:D-alanyl-D-alanine carboxypeptidase/D-alanyl-D-alanine-endopeptidase [uncultured Corynebacterium sp.]|uniref:D-alanyl-D-alanine carboxypeptidase/D-alanyl-D-alanine-endopeptidase n=1 Tax=uncultured Corynebacterium sp. TaxID=159447 RepID=UPI0025E6BA44|nr:D-alanyl-D-alanine carboxypeptidase [uncultured Corynebacterium sp.]
MLSVAAFAVVVCVIVVAGVAANANRVTVADAPQVPAVESPLLPVGLGGELDDGSGSAPSEVPADLKAQVDAVMSGAAGDPALGELTAVVSSAATGETLWEQAADAPSRPASAMKILTAAAALLQLDHGKTVTTRVVRYPGQDGVVLVGAGDPTLSVAGDGWYPGAASMAELAGEVRATLGVPEGEATPTVHVDVALFSDIFHSTWDRSGIEAGYIAPVDPVMVDGARLALDREDARRTPEPAKGAGQALADALGASSVDVLAPAGGAPREAGADARARFGADGVEPEVLGEVESAPLVARVHQMMVHSDNVLAESLAREVAISRGLTPDFAGAAQAVRDTLAEHGLALDGPGSGSGEAATLADSSGLSEDNRISPDQLDSVLLAAARGTGSASDAEDSTGDDEGATDVAEALRPLLDDLPVAGASGTLAGRYIGTGAADGAGWVRAKTGTLDGTSALAGTVTTQGGDVLTFVMLSNDAELQPARAAADAAAAGLHRIS